MLRLPKTLRKADKIKHCVHTIKSLDIIHVKDSLVGDAASRGVSWATPLERAGARGRSPAPRGRDGAKKRKPPPKALQNLIYRCFQILFKFLGFNLKDPPPSSISTLHRPEAPSNPITTP